MGFTVGSVPYTNARPLVHALAGRVDVEFALPSALPDLLDSGRAQAVMVSSFDALSTPGRCFAEGCSISSLGDAESVRLFSKVPFNSIRRLVLDSSSLTSNHLCQILLAERFGVKPAVISEKPNLASMLRGADACVLIGDKGMMADGSGLNVMDLGSEWLAMTGLPFVWALWVGIEGKLPTELVLELNESRAWGQANLEEVITDAQRRNNWPIETVRRYLSATMNYDLSERHLEGLRRYRELLRAHGFIGQTPFPEIVRAGAIAVG